MAVFRVAVSTPDAQSLTEELIADELAAGPQLTALERDTLVKAALAAAQTLVEALGHGPFTVRFEGADNLFRNETSFVIVEVATNFTYEADEAEPPDEAALVAEGAAAAPGDATAAVATADAAPADEASTTEAGATTEEAASGEGT